ncbi:DUF4864 domain-containing protein [Haloarcula salina]|uniref:DUF4864 domain-containing protein n=1 Tax=Haloarcula salina TaxID=1429914 RepID=A0AA41G1Q8_9EURY|nr:DUF4864 domain-containing protein [Haloarcula salina]MBV0902595.1 DUF4864 domain-containing protein [Haloarcula salina]
MARDWVVRLGVVCAVALLAGCGALFGGGQTAAETTVTPAAVPTDETPDGAGEAAGLQGAEREYWGNVTAANASAVTQPRVLDLRPTCRRPPGLVVHVQVLALRNNDPATNEGINTTWRFAAPSNRAVAGSYDNFVGTIRRGFRPLLNATAVRYGPLDRDGDTATQPVTVYDANGTATAYTWYLERQDGARYDGCWMTTGVSATPPSR